MHAYEEKGTGTVWEHVREIWQKRGLLYRSIKVDLDILYAGTSIGIFWLVLGPAVLLALYSLIYAFLFRVTLPNFTVPEYILNVFCGLVPFLCFGQSLSASASCMVKDQKLLYSIYPAHFIPLRSVLTSYVMLIVGSSIIIAGDFILSTPSYTLIYVPVIILLQVMFSTGVGFYLSIYAIVFRDVNFMIQYIVIFFFILTPIAYTPDMIPDSIKTIMYFNPLYYYVSGFQHVVILNTLPPLPIVVIGIALSFFVFFSGLWFFIRAQKVTTDLLS